MNSRAQSILEFTIIFAVAVVLFVGMISLWKAANDQIIKRQMSYNDGRTPAGSEEPTYGSGGGGGGGGAPAAPDYVSVCKQRCQAVLATCIAVDCPKPASADCINQCKAAAVTCSEACLII